MKFFFCDVETTGLDPVGQQIHQLSYIYMELPKGGMELDYIHAMDTFDYIQEISTRGLFHYHEGTINAYVDPHIKPEPKALELANLCAEELLHPDDLPFETGLTPTRMTQVQMYQHLYKVLGQRINKFNRADKAFLIAYNSPFDEDFLRQLWTNNMDNYFGSFFYWPSLCVAKMAAVRAMYDRHRLPNFKLSTVCQHFGVPFDDSKAHTADYDINRTAELFLRLI